MANLKPKDRAEAVALLRSEVIGALTRRDLDRGELREELRALRCKRLRPPGSYDRRLLRVISVDLLIIDDLGLRPLSGEEPADLYEPATSAHRR